MVLGLCFFLESLTFAFGCIVASVFYMSVTVLAEERVLREVFGQPYIEYCRRVPRIWPRFRLLRGSPTIIVSQLGLRAEAAREPHAGSGCPCWENGWPIYGPNSGGPGCCICRKLKRSWIRRNSAG